MYKDLMTLIFKYLCSWHDKILNLARVIRAQAFFSQMTLVASGKEQFVVEILVLIYALFFLYFFNDKDSHFLHLSFGEDVQHVQFENLISRILE